MQVFVYFTIFSTALVAHVLVGVIALRNPHFADGEDRTYKTKVMISLPLVASVRAALMTLSLRQ
jgi:hypothetical protein